MMRPMRAFLVVLLLTARARADWRPFVFSVDAETLRAREGALESGLGYNGLQQPRTQLLDERRLDGWLAAAAGLTDRVELAGALAIAEVPGRGVGLGDGRAE